ncbi:MULTISPECIES: CIA30 family protein [unclassified Guyparkeria]|uniref:CIA30 family protein n=1 Tax=unclassified Guyparkeria TaxID=2626246 RepID=UPI000733641F|nr:MULTISPECIES: CIA30 family protein [unclassified Guyparkeria]KTG17622.1 hypothetical protein AUR63_08220 [Guyparkeria sp. XI15]OAE88435.1 hypothetical protein AWR35_08235 [Guyparkeria sp. WRN-7]
MSDWLTFRDADEASHWRAVNDGVMGGVSAGRFRCEDGRGVFSGHLSLEHGGGFASVRRVVPAGEFAGTDGVWMRVRGDGRRYQCRVGSEQLPAGASYAAHFDTTADRWQDVSLPWGDFEAVFRGRRLANAPPLSAQRIERFGFLLADRHPGVFCLEITTVGLF